MKPLLPIYSVEEFNVAFQKVVENYKPFKGIPGMLLREYQMLILEENLNTHLEIKIDSPVLLSIGSDDLEVTIADYFFFIKINRFIQITCPLSDCQSRRNIRLQSRRVDRNKKSGYIQDKLFCGLHWRQNFIDRRIETIWRKCYASKCGKFLLTIKQCAVLYCWNWHTYRWNRWI